MFRISSRHSYFVLALLAASAPWTAPAFADDASVCSDGAGAPNARIAACTRAIGSGKWSGKNLSWAYDNRGNAYKAKNERDRAVGDYNESIRLDPNNAIAFNNRGIIYREAGDYDRSLADYNDAIRLDPNYSSAFTNRGLTYEKKNDTVRARADYNAVLSLPQKYDTAKWALDTAKERLAALSGSPAATAAEDDVKLCAEGNGTPDARVAACTRVIASGRYTGKNLSWAYDDRGNAYKLLNDPGRALTDYNESIRLDGNNAIAFNNRGIVYRERGEYDRSIADYTTALRFDPNYADAFAGRGLAYEQKKDLVRAREDFNSVMAREQKPGAGTWARDTARQRLASLGGGTPGTIAANTSVDDSMICADGTAASDARIAACTRSIGSGKWSGKNLSWAYDNRGNAYKAKGDHDRTLADYNEAIRLDPADAIGYNNRGIIFREDGQFDRAIQDYSEAIRIDPAYSSAFAGRALSYEKKNEIEKARADYNVALSLPQKYDTGRWAQDTARERLAALVAAPVVTPPVVTPPVVVVTPPVVTPPAGPNIATGPAAPAVEATPGRRVALVIGNSNYTSMRRLDNPRNDAEDMARALKAIGFDVTLGVDLKREQMEDMEIRFARDARNATTALVFYAGHGLQFQGENFLAPIDAKVEDETDLRRLVKLQDLTADIQNAAKVRILIIDACRDNGILQKMASATPRTRSAFETRGFARVKVEGTLVAFATQADRVAADGVERNSPFTKALLKNLPTPGLELRTMLTRVRSDVVASTGGMQRPEVFDSLDGEFVFKGQ